MYLFRGGMAAAEASNVPQEHMQKWMKWMESLG